MTNIVSSGALNSTQTKNLEVSLEYSDSVRSRRYVYQGETIEQRVCDLQYWRAVLRLGPTVTQPRCKHTRTHPFNGPLSGTTRVSLYQKSGFKRGKR